MFRVRKMLLLFICLYGLYSGMTVRAEQADYQNAAIEAEGFQKVSSITDGNRATYSSCKEEGVVTVSYSGGVAGVYVEFDRIPNVWTVENPANGTVLECGKDGFLHEFVDAKALGAEMPETLTLYFEAGTVITDIYVFGEGELPTWVQLWESPDGAADLLLLTSHSDDEQLFFSGILPYYAAERELSVQVAYVVQHFEANGVANHQRPHELLDGLWTVGVKRYPIMSEFPDLYAESKNCDVAFQQALKVYESAGIAYTDFLGYIIECLRRFKPLVVVSHDLNGEYGHGTHVVCARAVTEAISLATDETMYADSCERYGVWMPEKLYLHLYPENAIVMDWDVPLDVFDGKTAFEVSQEGFGCHKSQHWTWFYKWMYGTAERPIKKATDIKSYSPCHFGLYYTSVGVDVIGGDFFENVVTYEERRLAAEREAEKQRLAQLEADRIALEEAKRAEEARKEEEERARKKAEDEKLLKEQAVREAEQQALTEKKDLQKKRIISSIGLSLFLVVIIVIIWFKKGKGVGHE